MSEPTHIAFIGLGNMGGPMAVNLRNAGYVVKAFDVDPRALARARATHIDVVDGIDAATEAADVVVSMLPASQHVEALYLGAEGLLSRLRPNTFVVDCSTIAPGTAQAVNSAALARGIHMLDAPVSGGVAGAVAGTLTFIVGGECDTLDAVRPLLLAMGKNIFYMGASGSGQVAKLCNNMVLGVIMAATSEAIALGAARGISPNALSEMMGVSSARSWVTEVCNPWPGVHEHAPASKDYSGGFATNLMLKDLGLAVESALEVGASIPLGEVARNLYAFNRQAGRGELDFSSVVHLFSSHA